MKNRSRVKKRAIKFCPKCGSTDVFSASGLPQLRSIWNRIKRGYRGALILEDDKPVAKLEEEYAKRTVRK